MAKHAWLRSLLDCQVCELPCGAAPYPPHTRARARARTHTVIAGTDGATMHPMYFNLRVLCFALLADGWAVLLSNSEPREPFYYHDESNLTQWERPI